ncbi:MAG: hypothetical protein AAFO96_04355 [Bacteroidota bacterium]
MKILPFMGVMLFTLVFNLLYSQDNLTDYVPQSPEAEALFKYEDMPVSLFTGTPQINYPLLSISERMTGIDVSLSYHSSGIRVDETASWVGLGWSLNAGGIISRRMNGNPDDILNSVANGFLALREEFSYEDVIEEFDDENELLALNLVEGCKDMQPDEFYFSVGGYSGTFAFDWNPNAEPVVSSIHDVKVERILPVNLNDPTIASSIKGWKLTMPDGSIYLFEKQELTTTEGKLGKQGNALTCSGEEMEYVSSWHLTEIRSAYDQEIITLSYVPYHMEINWNESFSTRLGTVSNPPACPNGGIQAVGAPSNSIVNIVGQRLTEIQSENYKIRFIPEANLRADIGDCPSCGTNTDMYALSSLEMRERTNNRLIKKWNFSYSYRNNSTGIGSRLMLDGLTEIGVNGETKPGYQFAYNSNSLPDEKSYAKDHWGYYNMANQNPHMIPSYVHFGIGFYAYFDGADREPSLQGSLANVLEKITLPTGGTQEFEYELHTYGTVYKQAITSLQPYVINPQTYNDGKAANASQPGVVQSSSGNITVSNVNVTPIPVRVIIDGFTTTNIAAQLPKVEIFGNVNGGYSRTFTLSPPNPIPGNGGHQENYTETILLFPGQYTVVCSASNSNINGTDNISVSMSWANVDPDLPTTSKNAGGLRIKQIKTEAMPNDPRPIVKKFIYETEHNGVTISSGQLAYEPVYNYDSFSQVNNNQSLCRDCYFVTLLGASRAVLGSRNGSHIAYTRVLIQNGEQGEGGYTESLFSYTYDTLNLRHPYGPPSSNAYRSGQLINQKEFVAGASSPIQEVNNNYVYSNIDIPSIKVGTGTFGPTLATGCSDNNKPFWGDIFARWEYRLRLGVHRPNSVVMNKYENGQVISTTQNSQYDPNLHWLERQETINSDDSKEITTYTYLKDFSLPTASTDPKVQALKILSDQHILTYPIETKQEIQYGSQSPKVKGGTLLTFKEFSPNKVYPFEVYQLETDALLDKNLGNISGSTYTIDAQILNNNFVFDDTHFEKRVVSQKYDAYGRILELEKENGGSQALLWYGNKNKPMAHVVNGQEAQSAYTSFERISFSEIATRGWDILGGFQIQSNPRGLSLASGLNMTETFRLESYDGSDISISISVPNAANIASCLLQSRRLIFTNLDNGLQWDPSSNSTQIALPPGNYEVSLECGCQGVPCGTTNGAPDLTVALSYTNTANITNALGHGEPAKTGIEALKLYDVSSSDRIQVISKNIPSGKYLLSFWYKGDPVKVRVNDGGTVSESLTHGSGATNPSTFQYFEKEVVLSSSGTVELVSENQGDLSYLDELRLHPKNAQMTTYCFYEDLRLHTQTGINNRSTYYQYDAFGRLQYIKDQEGHYVQGYEYNYQN